MNMKLKMLAITNSMRVFSYLVMILELLLFGIVEIVREFLFIIQNVMRGHNMVHSFHQILSIFLQVVDLIVLSKCGISETAANLCLLVKIKVKKK